MTLPADVADIREWNDWSLPIASRYPKNPDHPFCTGHTYDALQCGLPEFSPEALSADHAAYALVAEHFSKEGAVPPSLERLAEYVPDVGASATDEARDRAARILGVPRPLSDRCVWVSWKGTIMLLVPWEAWPDELPSDVWWLEARASDDAGVAPGELAIPTPEDLDSDLECWRSIQLHTLVERVMELQKSGQEASNPLVPLIRGVPLEVAPSLSTERRILPAMALRGSGRTPSPSQGILFPLEGMGPQETRVRASFLPGFRFAGPHVSPLLELWELGGGRQRNGGHTVPVCQRVFIEALLGVPWGVRNELVVVYRVRLDQFLKWIWPNQPPSRVRYIEAIEEAAAYLDRFRVAFFCEDTGLWGRHRVVDFLTLPTWTRRPSEEEIRIRVHLPPGSRQGPQVSDNLRRYSVESAPCWRALLMLPFMWDDPGRTLVPAGGPGPWVRTRKKKKHPVLNNADLVRILFPVSENQAGVRRALLPRALEHLERLQRDGELYLDGSDDQWQILPPEFLEWERQ